MKDTLLLGVDLGTMGTKASLYDIDGNLIDQTYEESILRYPKVGWVEQQLDEIYGSAVRCIASIIQKSNVDSKQIKSIGFSSQMSGIGMIDKDWNPLAHYDSWLDTRCEQSFPAMNEIRGEITRRSGCPPTYAHLAKIIWWKKNNPEIFSKINKFIVPSTYVAGKMAALKGEDAYIDVTCLHFSGLSNNKNKEWSEKLLHHFGIPRSKMPRIVSPTEIIGHVSKELAMQTGLVEGTPIAAGAGDSAAASLGAGVVNFGEILDNAGTASILSLCLQDYKPDEENQVVLASNGVVPGTYNALSFINGGGLNLRWFRDEFAVDEKKKAKELDKEVYQLLDEMANEIDPGSGGAIFIPHTQGRVLPPDSSVRGIWSGFTWSHTKKHMFRSILESVAYEYAYYLQIVKKLNTNLEFHEVRVVGGGANSNLWNQIKSDVLNIPYSRINRPEVGTWGTAMIAGKAIGIYDDLREVASKSTTVIDQIQPREEYHHFYKKYVKVYRQILENYHVLYQDLRDLPRKLK